MVNGRERGGDPSVTVRIPTTASSLSTHNCDRRMLAKTSRTIALCSTANFINAADRIIMPIAIIPMTDQFKWNLYWQGWILSAFAFGYITSQVSQSA